MCIRCTLEGSSWGRSGWRAAGAVVKGVGMALELVLTAAAGLANDFAARLLTAIFGLWKPLCGWKEWRVKVWVERETEVELCCELIVRYPLEGCSSYRWPITIIGLILANLL